MGSEVGMLCVSVAM